MGGPQSSEGAEARHSTREEVVHDKARKSDHCHASVFELAQLHLLKSCLVSRAETQRIKERFRRARFLEIVVSCLNHPTRSEDLKPSQLVHLPDGRNGVGR